MKHLALLAALAAFTLPAIGQNYDYCIKARRTDIGPYPPARARTASRIARFFSARILA
jgi:hypothetical protein